jgi:hypothetical protein
MSVAAGVGKAAGAAEMLTGARPARGRAYPRMKSALVVAVTLLALAAFAGLIPASEAPNTEHSSSAGSTPDRSGAGAPVSQPVAAPRMSEEETFEAYAKLPLSFVPNEGQTSEEMVRYDARGARYAPLIYT